MLFILFQLDGFGQIINISVNSDADKTAFFGRFQFLDMLALPLTYNRSKNLQSAAGLERKYLVYDLVNGLLFDFTAADRALGDSDSGIKQPKIIVNFSDSSDSRPRVF